MKNYDLKRFLKARGIKNDEAEGIAEILKNSGSLIEGCVGMSYKIGACCI